MNYVLLVCEQNSGETFEVWSANLLADYIGGVEPGGRWTFVVGGGNNVKCPVVGNHGKGGDFGMLN